jgi:hypothetical protein
MISKIHELQTDILNPGDSTESGVIHAGPTGIGVITVEDTPATVTLTVASDQNGTGFIWQAQNELDLGLPPGAPPGLPAAVLENQLVYVAGVPATLTVNVSFPFIRVRFTNGGVGTTVFRLYSFMTFT